MKSTLLIKDYLLFVRLGCSAQERKKAQKVFVSLRVEFSTPPKACISDQLSDTVCYNLLCEEMKRVVFKQEFNTIEYLGHLLYTTAQKQIAEKAHLILTVHKACPPVKNLKGGSFFEIAG